MLAKICKWMVHDSRQLPYEAMYDSSLYNNRIETTYISYYRLFPLFKLRTPYDIYLSRFLLMHAKKKTGLTISPSLYL